MVEQSEVTTQSQESSIAEQGAEQRAEKVSLEEAEAQAMKWLEACQAKRKKHEWEALAEARLLEEAESQAEQMRQLKEQAKPRHEPSRTSRRRVGGTH